MDKKTEKALLIKEVTRLLKESEDAELINLIYILLLKADKKV